MRNKLTLVLGGAIFILISGLLVLYLALFGAPQSNATQESTFVVPLEARDSDTVARLQEQRYVKNTLAFNFVRTLRGYGQIPSGGYNLPKNESVWMIAYELFVQPPDMKWVVIPEGWRKEQIGEELAEEFGWSDQELVDWNEKYTAMKYDYLEGVYFPDTYLIPTSEKNFEVAQRMVNRFNEEVGPYVDKFYQKDIQWTTGLKIASLIQRETANPADMPLISGIIWNRLLSDMKLDIDATLQYAKGKTDGQWWATVTPDDKDIGSPYNTYLNKGLPPTPISNPGLDAIEAALTPAETDCIFYLHDGTGQMHCSKTYEEHLENIEKYLN